ncbi:class Ib ribonucleoside-diphosphate reductase assembly flavoprotein NrdI [Lampropedia aestuarii]|uniref:Protein NrdI n=1 Tax=Lampropedia aestuarii TaxID=2562762 RepID=A0A4S5BQH1_9BURK|nr:class Ib ribonucleoside-diphosphate reductase assembly flavoprotein NrdI [Lampropedia aestuarii]MDH5856142.1 class Ib ribonucleoside-diphosphate reductase assembly flavoprotein NrdI [Lampropedia aestuarii]THJ33423.1 class Ib ribonucleoside-diphosphate reductase assembly flavoprotein NrdI [Lampropedia aestuarii]
MLVYFSSVSENTHRFVQKLQVPAQRIPIKSDEAAVWTVDAPYILVVPSYGGGNVKGAVPKPVIQFLNQEHNRRLIRGVIAAGNTNFGTAYCMAGAIIAHKCQVPLMYKFELLGTPEDVDKVRAGVRAFFNTPQAEDACTA